MTKEDIFLVQRPLATNMQNPSNRIVSMQRPLHPGTWVPSLPSQNRHCFYAQIPELGVFIVASPIGRAAVFSLYWTQDRGSPRRRYGVKLEYLLPFCPDNENQIAGVPFGRMLVVAVSPVQGTFLLLFLLLLLSVSLTCLFTVSRYLLIALGYVCANGLWK